ncbi:uncharacterized protein FOBCDRAFT_243089 [Fusarium oxysporum Fo47]|uniref:uncharacterized protein n=1 Tax=Fusarium oxysporum Fo47 TaxID=660027 RepID=UPI002869D4EE|nr:uncharacterized protein FOBCDRAFT_243089 [Fusarium oxysporum Fo47]WJG36082.1 hypothetical protein FOBCDRAFT_243089 [Fusarium oxysporum Fo47]
MTLLHHWTASTSQQVAKDKEIRNFWQNTATSVALQHLYVLQEIMSVAALHLAYLSQSEKSMYMEIASEHHIRSLQGFHTAVSQCRNDIEQGSTVFLWSLLNMFYVCLTLGRLGCSSDICRVLGTVWIRLIRGIESVIEDNRPAVESDNFNAISMGEEAGYFSRLAEQISGQVTKKKVVPCC